MSFLLHGEIMRPASHSPRLKTRMLLPPRRPLSVMLVCLPGCSSPSSSGEEFFLPVHKAQPILSHKPICRSGA